MDRRLRELQREAQASGTPEAIAAYLAGLARTGVEFLAFPMDLSGMTPSDHHLLSRDNTTVFCPVPYLPGETLVDIINKERDVFMDQGAIPEWINSTYGQWLDNILFPPLPNHVSEIDDVHDYVLDHVNSHQLRATPYVSLEEVSSDFIDATSFSRNSTNVNHALVLTKDILLFLWPLVDQFFEADVPTASASFSQALHAYSLVEFMRDIRPRPQTPKQRAYREGLRARGYVGMSMVGPGATRYDIHNSVILHDGPISC
jgi:hypothetical protein